MAPHQLALSPARFELAGDHSDRDAGGAIDAARAVGDRLAAAEADAAERLVQFAGVRPVSSVKTFRSTLPGRYGHGLGFVTKNFGKRKGALTRDLSQMVTQPFMRLVNANEKSSGATYSTGLRCCPAGRQESCPSVGESVQLGAFDPEAGSLRVARRHRRWSRESRASHSTSMTVSLAGSALKIRLWRISMTLAPAS